MLHGPKWTKNFTQPVILQQDGLTNPKELVRRSLIKYKLTTIKGLLAVKLGMFTDMDDWGNLHPLTVLQVLQKDSNF